MSTTKFAFGASKSSASVVYLVQFILMHFKMEWKGDENYSKTQSTKCILNLPFFNVVLYASRIFRFCGLFIIFFSFLLADEVKRCCENILDNFLRTNVSFFFLGRQLKIINLIISHEEIFAQTTFYEKKGRKFEEKFFENSFSCQFS